MVYELNFLSKAADRQKRKRVRRLTAIIYVAVWLFSGYVLLQVYMTQKYMANVYQSRVSSVEKEIAQIEPRTLFLEKKIARRNQLRKQAPLYVQSYNRPSSWYARLLDITKLLPYDLILTKIAYHPTDKKNSPEITIDGYMIIQSDKQDIFMVDQLRAALEESLPTKSLYSKLRIENNKIYKEKDNLKLVFTVGYYQ